MCLLNVRSVKNKAPLILDHIVEEGIDIMAITETWLRPGSRDDVIIGDITPSGYTMLHEPRNTGRGGGVGAIMRDTITAKVEPLNTTYTTFECIKIKAITSSLTYRFITIYRPPPSSKNKLTTNDFFEEFDNFLCEIILTKGKLIIMGDVNFHLDDKDNPDTQRFTGLLDSYGLEQLVQQPTHRSTHILDVVITRINENPTHNLDVVDYRISDHKAVNFSLDTQRPPLPKKTIVYRDTRRINISNLKKDIQNNDCLNGNTLEELTNSEECVKLYNEAAKSLLDKHAPEKTKTITIRPKSEWQNQEIDTTRREKRKCERKWRATGLTVHREMYCEARNRLMKAIASSKKDYISKKIADASDSQKALFNCLDYLFHRSKTSCLPDIDDSEELADKMAEFFTGKVEKIRDELRTIQTEAEESRIDSEEQVPMLTTFPPITADELKEIIMKAATKSCQLDPLPTNITKECIDFLLPALLKIINTSLASSTVPMSFKKALVTPLIKKPSLDRDVLKNYRPVSNLPFLSKILEKVIAKYLKVHKAINNLEVPLQSAYRQYHSTETALLKVQNDILRSLDNGECVFLVLLDLSAAFDTVDHRTLQNCLERTFGISGEALAWLKSYMSDRQQSVSIRGTQSNEKLLRCGVPQGSVLGPELFKDYITPLASIIESHDVHFHGYADDTQLYVTFKPGQDEDSALDKLERCITDVRRWMASNWLKLNDDKTEFIILGSPANLAKVTTEAITIGNHRIEKCHHVRNIGAVFDSTMRMEVQVNKVSQTAWFHLYSISKIRQYLTKEQSQAVIHAYVTSRLDQNNSLLSGLPATLLNKLQKVQNAAAKIILQGKRVDHVTPLLKKLHWLPLNQRHVFKTLLLVFKCVNDKGPKYLKNLLLPKPDPRPLRSSSENLLDITRTNLVTYGDRAFSVVGPKQWNMLPLDIRSCTTVYGFKKALKSHLFRNAYPDES